MPALRVHRFSRGADGGAESGDRCWVEQDAQGAVRALLADAPGHGALGEAFWRTQGPTIEVARQAWLVAPVGPDPLRRFGQEVGAHLHAAPPAGDAAVPPYLACLLLAWTPPAPHARHAPGPLPPGPRPSGPLPPGPGSDPSPALHVVTWGWGVHALIETARGPWWPPIEERVGLKLGWVHPREWERTPRACPIATVRDVRRVLLLTDGFLGDDHRDPQATLETLRAIGEETARRGEEEALEWLVAAHPPGEDDATAVVVTVFSV
mgnify:CR=1 FL=1